MLWSFHNQNSQWEGVLFIWYTHTVNDICVVPQVVIRNCFTVKSADSGIQNSADGSREMLANTASNNSLADAGKTQRLTSVITYLPCLFISGTATIELFIYFLFFGKKKTYCASIKGRRMT